MKSDEVFIILSGSLAFNGILWDSVPLSISSVTFMLLALLERWERERLL